MLVEHRVDDVDERLVGGEDAVAAREEVPLQPTLTGVLAQHLHHSAVGRQVVVLRDRVLHPSSPRDLEQRAQPVGCQLVRGEDTEVA